MSLLFQSGHFQQQLASSHARLPPQAEATQVSFLSDGVYSEKEHGEAFDEHTQTTAVISFAAFVIIMCIEEDFTGRSIDFELHR